MGCRNNLYISRPLESQPVWHGMYRCIDGTNLATVCLPPPATGSALSSTQVRTERLQPFGHQPAPSLSLSRARLAKKQGWCLATAAAFTNQKGATRPGPRQQSTAKWRHYKKGAA